MTDSCNTSLPPFLLFGLNPADSTPFGAANFTGFATTISNVTLSTTTNISAYRGLYNVMWDRVRDDDQNDSDISDILDLLNQLNNTLGCLDNVVGHLRQAAYHIALPMVIVLGIISLLGTAGNILVLMVYKRERRASSGVFILQLALVDLAMCWLAIPLEINNFLQWSKEHNDWSCKFSVYFVQTSLLCSILTLAAVAMDRYFAICRPFEQTMTVKRAKLIAVGVVVLGFVLNCPILFVYGVNKYVPDQDGRQFGTCKVLDLYAHEPAVSIFLSANFVVFVVCSVAIVVLYTLLFCKVLKHHRTVRPKLFGQVPGSPPSTPIPKSHSMRSRDKPTVFSAQKETNTESNKQQNGRIRRSLSDPAIPTLVTNPRLKTLRAVKTQETRPSSSLDRSEDSGHETDGPETCRSSPVMRSEGGNASVRSSCQRRLATRAKSRYRSPRMSSPHVQTAKMLALATLVFILTWLPHWIMTFLNSDPRTASPFISTTAQAIFLVLDRLYLLNSVLNPVIYSFASRGFRIALKNTVMCKRQRRVTRALQNC